MKKNLTVIILIIATLISGIASIVTTFNVILGIVLTGIGIFLTVIQIISDNIKNNFLSQMIETQNLLLASSGAGNVYHKIFKSEIAQKGKSPKGIELLKKAYQLDPNNMEVIESLSTSLALSISFSSWATISRSKEIETDKDWILAKTIAECGLKKKPKEHIFMDVLGILYDTIDENEKARQYFSQSSKLRKDPYWHLLMATSWEMSGNSDKAVQEVEQVVSNGRNNWISDRAYGEALAANGRCEESLYYLNRAQKARGMHPGISYYRMQARMTLGKFSFQSIIDYIYLLFYLIIYEKWHSGKRIFDITIDFFITIITTLSRFLWAVTSKVPLLENLHCRVSSPGVMAFILGTKNFQRKDYSAATNYYKICYSICPKSIPVLGNLAGAYAFLGDKDNALKYVDIALSLEPNNQMLIWNKQQYVSGVKLNPRLGLSEKAFKKAYKEKHP